MIRKLGMAFCLLFPWFLKRWLMRLFFGFELDPSSRIGFAWVLPGHLKMGPGAEIQHRTFAHRLDLIEMGEGAIIGRGNVITGWPRDLPGEYETETERRSELIMEEQSCIVLRNYLDCSNSVRLGAYSYIGGTGTKVLTHYADIPTSVVRTAPVRIGHHCMVNSDCTITAGAVLPDCSVLGAKSLLNKAHSQDHRFYGGAPAEPIKELDPAFVYFHRSTVHVRP